MSSKPAAGSCLDCGAEFANTSGRGRARKRCINCAHRAKNAQTTAWRTPERVAAYNDQRRVTYVPAAPRQLTCPDCLTEFSSQGTGNGKRRFCITCSRDRDTARHAHRKRFERKGDLDAGTVARMKSRASKCPLCASRMTDALGPRKKHLDHIIPKAAGGLHVLTNVRVICATCNLARPQDASDLAQLPIGVAV